jgi:hypothetical protein
MDAQGNGGLISQQHLTMIGDELSHLAGEGNSFHREKVPEFRLTRQH